MKDEEYDPTLGTMLHQTDGRGRLRTLRGLIKANSPRLNQRTPEHFTIKEMITTVAYQQQDIMSHISLRINDM
jgi:hypothetical protein